MLPLRAFQDFVHLATVEREKGQVSASRYILPEDVDYLKMFDTPEETAEYIVKYLASG